MLVRPSGTSNESCQVDQFSLLVLAMDNAPLNPPSQCAVEDRVTDDGVLDWLFTELPALAFAPPDDDGAPPVVSELRGGVGF